jgi:hypothetical protein
MVELPVPLVSGNELPEEVKRALRPGTAVRAADGRPHELPRQFLRVDSWEVALNTRLTEHFMLWELIGVDVRETPVLRGFPRYVPCAVLLLAAALELFRLEVDTYVHVAANGGYRSPGHAVNRQASRHSWGTAANIYRVGDDYLDGESVIGKYAAAARRAIPGIWVRPFGQAPGEADDHLHLDLGYTVFEPAANGEGAASNTT